MVNQSRRAICGGMAATSFSSLVPKKCFGKNLKDLPNIIFILADDLGYGDIGVYGHANIKTPCIDKLSRQGLKLTQAYSNSPVCSATRVALMTGRYQYRLRAGLEEPIGPGEKLIGLPPDCQTLPSSLKKHGYTTALIGKWHLGYLPNFLHLKVDMMNSLEIMEERLIISLITASLRRTMDYSTGQIPLGKMATTRILSPIMLLIL